MAGGSDVFEAAQEYSPAEDALAPTPDVCEPRRTTMGWAGWPLSILIAVDIQP